MAEAQPVALEIRHVQPAQALARRRHLLGGHEIGVVELPEQDHRHRNSNRGRIAAPAAEHRGREAQDERDHEDADADDEAIDHVRGEADPEAAIRKRGGAQWRRLIDRRCVRGSWTTHGNSPLKRWPDRLIYWSNLQILYQPVRAGLPTRSCLCCERQHNYLKLLYF